MGGGISCGFALVGGDGQQLLSPGDHGANGDFPPLSGALCGEQGAAHHGEIRRSCGVGPEVLVHGADDIRGVVRIVCQSHHVLGRSGRREVGEELATWQMAVPTP